LFADAVFEWLTKADNVFPAYRHNKSLPKIPRKTQKKYRFIYGLCDICGR
jgi:hypothetical protein